MKRRWVWAVVAAGIALAAQGMLAPSAVAAEEEAKNLKVLKDNGKILEDGMKAMTKGLGVKCNACHVKGDYASDDVAAKEDSRRFFLAVLGEADAAKRNEALTALAAALKVKKVRKPDAVWDALKKFEKK